MESNHLRVLIRFVHGNLGELLAILLDLNVLLDVQDYMNYRKYKYLRLDGSSTIMDRRDMVKDFQHRYCASVDICIMIALFLRFVSTIFLVSLASHVVYRSVQRFLRISG